MFGNSITIIVSSKNILLLDKNQTSIKLPIQKTEATFNKIAITLKKIIRFKSVNILLADDLAYTFCLLLGEKPSTENLIKLLSKQIPENLEPDTFAWQLITAKANKYLTQIFVPTQTALSLIDALKREKIKVDNLQALPLTLASFLKDKKQTWIILDQREQLQTLTLNHEGAVLSSMITSDEKLLSDIKDATKTVEDFKISKIAGILLTSDKTPASLQKLKDKINISKINLDLKRSLIKENNLQITAIKNKTSILAWLKKNWLTLIFLDLVFLVLITMLFLSLNKSS